MKQTNNFVTRIKKFRLFLGVLSLCFFSASFNAQATVVEFQTSLGNFEVNLTDEATPETVRNFLQYVEDGDYINSVIHRSVENFIVQGGGFIVDVELPLTDVPDDGPILNEPTFSNRRGTIAMAKVPGNANSATSEWFFNLVNNSGALDDQNSGFTVFGEVVGDGMDVVDAIAALPIYDFGGVITDLPLRDYTDDDFANEVIVDTTKLVVISGIVITDAAVDTAAGLELAENTATLDFLENRASGIGPWLMFALTALLLLRFGFAPRSRAK